MYNRSPSELFYRHSSYILSSFQPPFHRGDSSSPAVAIVGLRSAVSLLSALQQTRLCGFSISSFLLLVVFLSTPVLYDKCFLLFRCPKFRCLFLRLSSPGNFDNRLYIHRGYYRQVPRSPRLQRPGSICRG